jgi:hypothetical protein
MLSVWHADSEIVTTDAFKSRIATKLLATLARAGEYAGMEAVGA